MTQRDGGCLCGAVRFSATRTADHFSACHCEMCRRWTGSALLSLAVPADALTWHGEAHIRTLQSSDWAERAWCGRCGSPLYYRLTTDGPMAAYYTVPLGLFDDTGGLEFTTEIFVDQKPACFAFAGERERLSRADTLAKYGGAEGSE